jgi:glycosyltransferase involved in cell wall biosynthesis
MTTEGTYPYVVGGVTTWCRQLLGGLDDIRWELLPIVAGDVRHVAVTTVPDHVTVHPAIELWGPWRPPRRSPLRGAGPGVAGSPARPRAELPAILAQALLGWGADVAEGVVALSWCRRHPEAVVPSFRAPGAWEGFVEALRAIAAEDAAADAVDAAPGIDAETALDAYRTLSWVARAAAVETPVTDATMVTAAGWAAVPALVDKALRGTPMLLVEHGLYVREAYLAAVRSDGRPAQLWFSTRLARGLARSSYSGADLVVPVSPSHRPWEESLGVERARVRPIPNAVAMPDGPRAPLPGTRTVVSVGRLDPLKDIATMLRVAARVRTVEPRAQFRHYGPVSSGQQRYADACYALHRELGLGDGFRFMGSTSDPMGVVREADVVLMTSISEGLPMAMLEAMAQARPVVTTDVGGVRDCVRGAGVTAPTGDVEEIAAGVLMLLRHPTLADHLGQCGRERVARLFDERSFLDAYRDAVHAVAGTAASASTESTAA